MKLTTEIGSLTLSNPTILAAGILGTTGASLKRVAGMGAGAVVTKSIGIEPKFGHHNPSLVKLEHGYLNAMGLPNPAYREFSQELTVARESKVPVIASIFGATEDEFVEVARGLLLAETAVEVGPQSTVARIAGKLTNMVGVIDHVFECDALR